MSDRPIWYALKRHPEDKLGKPLYKIMASYVMDRVADPESTPNAVLVRYGLDWCDYLLFDGKVWAPTRSDRDAELFVEFLLDNTNIIIPWVPTGEATSHGVQRQLGIEQE